MLKQTILLAALTLALAGPAFAEDPGPGGPGGAEPKTHPADTDGDGLLSRSEMTAMHEKRMDEMFSKHDADKDGKMSREEMKSFKADMRSKYRSRHEEMKGKREDRKEKMEKMKESRNGRGGGVEGEEIPE